MYKILYLRSKNADSYLQFDFNQRFFMSRDKIFRSKHVPMKNVEYACNTEGNAEAFSAHVYQLVFFFVCFLCQHIYERDLLSN